MESSVTGKPGLDDLESLPDEKLEQVIEAAQAILVLRVQATD